MFKDKQYSATVTHAVRDAARQKGFSDMTYTSVVRKPLGLTSS